MPYNNSAIPPTAEITGAATLPLARVKRILQVDDNISSSSANATFAITIATEMFIRYLAEQSLHAIRSERKPRRNIQYKDLASAVARVDNLEFLSDVVPRTMTYREYKEKKARKAKAEDSQPLPNGQRTLDNLRVLPRRPAEVADSVKGDDESLTPEEDSQETIDDLPPEAYTRSRRTTNGSRYREASNASAQQNDSSAQQDDSGEDVDMTWDD